MLFIPAIDLIDGRCVRLSQGDYSQRTQYKLDPVETARMFQDEGARYIHIVDLDAARDVRTGNRELIRRIVEAVDIPVEVGGGIRNSTDVQQLLDSGVERVVLGTIIGDLHDIGKEIIKSLLISDGFKVYDLGVDVPPKKFVDKAIETNSSIIGISALLSTSIANTADVVEALKEAGIREEFKIIIGGAAARSWMIEKYGVDAAVYDGIKGLKTIRKWVER